MGSLGGVNSRKNPMKKLEANDGGILHLTVQEVGKGTEDEQEAQRSDKIANA